MEILKSGCEDIRSLKIQGATNVARYGVKILKEFVMRHKNEYIDVLWENIQKAVNLIYNSRDTEPAMRNGLKYILKNLEKERNSKSNLGNINIPEIVERASEEYIKILEDSKKKITEIGANRIPLYDKPQEFTILTHCHSSIVTGILIEAWRQGKKFNVICTETRPVYQGRITAKELLKEGIPVKMIVDSAMRWAVRNYNVKMIITGADAITSEGTVLNKIGSRLLALVAREMHVPYYVATPLLKFNPDTTFGILEKIDKRSWTEIWSEKPDELEILNPAFETVSRRYIDGLITESGIFPATLVFERFYNTYPIFRSNDI